MPNPEVSGLIVEAGTWAEFEVARSTGPGLAALGAFLRELRARRGQSMRALSRATGVSQPYISMIEKSAVKGAPSLRILSALAEHFGIPTDTFLVVSGMMGAADGPRSHASVEDGFQELILHAALRPSELDERDLRWISTDLQRVLLDFALRLHQELAREPQGEVATMLAGLRRFHTRGGEE
jgi:transcriptional regulator with XRE-family HTH domain